MRFFILAAVVAVAAAAALVVGAAANNDNGNGGVIAPVGGEPSQAPTGNHEARVFDHSHCAEGAEGHTALEKFICRQAKVENMDNEKCSPKIYYPAATGDAQTLVVLLHGLSACPQQFEEVGPATAALGATVFSPTYPGHSLKSGCVQPTAGAAALKMDCVAGSDVTDLPFHSREWLNYVDSINELVGEWKKANPSGKAVISGLSAGALLASAAGSKSPHYDRQVLLSPFFGITNPGGDREYTKCLGALPDKGAKDSTACTLAMLGALMPEGAEQAKPVIEKALSSLVLTGDWKHGAHAYQDLMSVTAHILAAVSEKQAQAQAALKVITDEPLLDGLLQRPFGWGAGCRKNRETNNRGGFCDFRIGHLLALHSLGLQLPRLALSSKNDKMEVFVVPVERDGFTRNGLVFNVVKNVARAGEEHHVANMWRIDPKCTVPAEVNNKCGVPHSSLAREDNSLEEDGVWWIDGFVQHLAKVLHGGKAAAPDWGKDVWPQKREVPHRMHVHELRNPNADPHALLVADIPKVDWVKQAGKLADANVRKVLREFVLHVLGAMRGSGAEDGGVTKFIASSAGAGVQKEGQQTSGEAPKEGEGPKEGEPLEDKSNGPVEAQDVTEGAGEPLKENF